MSHWIEVLKARRRKAFRFVEYKRLKRIRNHRSPQYSYCKNCGTALQGMYCHKCGQYALDSNQSFFKYIQQFLENAYQLDGKVFQTLRYLFTKPGFLSKEFMAGKINSYVHPLKLFMFASIVFFTFIFALYSGDSYVNAFTALSSDVQATDSIANILQTGQPVDKAITDSIMKEFKTEHVVDKAAMQQEKNSTIVDKKKDKKSKKDKKDDPNDIKMTPKMLKAIYLDAFGQTSKYLPLMLLFLLPIFAFILRLLFRKTQPDYMASFVVSIHIHTVLILVVSFMVLIHVYIGALWFFTYLLYGFLLYLLLVMRAFYHNNWFKTVIKTGLSLFLYLIVLGLATFSILLIIASHIKELYIS